MKTELTDSSNKRISMAVAVGVIIVLAAGAIYLFTGGGNYASIDGIKIVAAARAYSHAMREANAKPEPTVSLQTLIDKGFLKPSDTGGLEAMDARIFLVATGHPAILMRVHMADGTDLVLLEDGTVHPLRK